MVLIDWGFVGSAALGEEIAPLVAGSEIFGHPAEELADVWANTTRFLQGLEQDVHWG